MARLRDLITRLRSGAPLVAARPPQGGIQVGSVGQKLIEAFQIKGKSVAPELGDVVHPVAVVEDLTNANWYTPQVERPCGGGTEFTPTVGQFASIQLYNPLGSNVVAIIDEFIVVASANSGFIVSVDANNPGTLINNATAFRDTLHYLPSSTKPAVEVRTLSLGALPGGNAIYQGRLNVNGSGICQVKIGCVLGPGTLLTVMLNTITLVETLGGLWRERPLGE